jgi:CSLREA domain-containing protein
MMMRIKPTLRALLALAAVLVAIGQADTTTITVTTFADDNGTDPSTCSLREAVQAVNTKLAFGGCPAGARVGDNVIQLDAGRYPLTGGELAITSAMTIKGQDTNQPDVVNPLTRQKPNRIRPTTTIVASPSSRIINASGSVSLTDLVLTGNGTVANASGGAIYSSGNVVLDNVTIDSAAASGSGGAIFLAKDGTNLSMSDVMLRNNSAGAEGGAIAMVCQQDLLPYATHAVTLLRTLLAGNSAGTGAGAVHLCGSTTFSATSSTLSGNTSASGKAAIDYVQGSGVGIGSIAINYMTAAEQTGSVLSANGLGAFSLNGSVIAFNNGSTTSAPTVANCSNPNPAVPVATTVTGGYNVEDDSTCNAFQSSGHNSLLDYGTTSFSNELVPLSAGPYGLTDYYLPQATSLYLVDKGDAFTSCSTADQRNVTRQSGTSCDIGAVELLQLTANNDTADSEANTDRLAHVDILANDVIGEPPTSSYTVNVTDSGPGFPSGAPVKANCVWDPVNEKLNVDNGGELTGSTPIVCKYTIMVNSVVSNEATVTVNIKNQAPVAVADTYIRPVGQSSISFNPLDNDNDSKDGIYGTPAQWAGLPFYPISIGDKPQLGTITGASGPCPDSTAASPKTCYAPPLTYTSTNNLAPFSDSFTYRVFDKDYTSSNLVRVTINTDAPNPDQGGTGGALDAGAGIALLLLGLRRARRL